MAAIRLLNRRSVSVAEAPVKVWEVGDPMCSKLLVAVMPDLVDALERHGELELRPEVRASTGGGQRSQHRPAAETPAARSWAPAPPPVIANRVFRSVKREAMALGGRRIVHRGDWQARLLDAIR